MEQRDFLGDEVHMMQSDIKALRQENELLKMKNERQDETILILRDDVSRLHTAREELMIENATLRSILDNVGQVVSTGITRYLARRSLKRDTVRMSSPRPETTQTVQQSPVSSSAVQESTVQEPEDNDPPPQFLQSMGVDHPLLPRVQVQSDEQVAEEIRQLLGN